MATWNADTRDMAGTTNGQRADTGAKAVEIGSQGTGDDPHCNLMDALANIMHHAAREGLDFNSAAQGAAMHFEAERDGE